jgi:uncharacterized membrane protein YeaQ/YmgE (transglycosylase-associated protein family)
MGRRLHEREQPRSVEQQLVRECDAMIRYASAAGLAIPEGAVTTIRSASAVILPTPAGAGSTDGGGGPSVASNEEVKSLVREHAVLAKLISPATPRTALLLHEEEPAGGVGRILGPIRLVRLLMAFALVLLTAFVLLLSFSDAGGSPDPLQAAITSESPWRSLWSALYILSAAGLGAAFAGLFKANSRVAEGRFDPAEESSYWVTIVLGLIAGVVLAHVIPDNFQALGKLTKPLLALVGGFSAPAVHAMLQRIVETVQALVRGSAEELVADREREVQARAAAETVETRLQLATEILKLEKVLSRKGVPSEARTRVEDLIDELLGKPSAGAGK